MAKILTLDAYICDKSTHENIFHIGNWTFGVCADTGITNYGSGKLDKDFSFFDGLVDSFESFGGPLQHFDYAGNREETAKIRKYVPNVTGAIISTAYKNYALKLVNKAGWYGIKALDVNSSVQTFELYDNNKTSLGVAIPLSCNLLGSGKRPNVNWSGLVVSKFVDDKFDITSKIYGFSINSNLNWSISSELYKNQSAIDFLNNTDSKEAPKKDPYTEGSTSGSAGGGGTFGGGNTIFGGASDAIDIPPLPTASASDAGFITLFNPTLGQLNNLASYMWSDLFSIDTFKKIFADPMDCILGLSIVPVKPASAGTSSVKIGNISTDVAMNKTSSQYAVVDCGIIDVKEYWGAYLDYAPYTQCEIYLPYVGTKQISVDDVMNKAVHVVYHVDILSGACNAYVKCGDSVLYTFVGQCSSSIPISGNDWTTVLNGAISVAGKIGLAMATGGATALMSGLGAASSIISSSKPTVERSGAMSSTGGLLGIQKPYLILTRPKQALPENQNKYTGYPSFITMALSECTGYTEIDSVHLENMTCTDEETREIENILKSGVIF